MSLSLILDLGAGANLQSERISVAAGTPVDLPCRLPPTADLTWSREGGVTLPTAAQPFRNILRLERVADKDSGRYICSSQGRTQYIDLSVERELILLLLIFYWLRFWSIYFLF